MEQSEPSARPLLSTGGTEWTERSNQVEMFPVNGAKSNTAQKANDAEEITSTHSDLYSKKGGNVSKHMWGQSWTLETLSLVIAILGLAGLVATLLVHQSKPLPQWPQLVTINSIISLFSLLMRSCVGVVMTEGLGQCKWNWYRKAKRLDHMERLDSASHGSWGSLNLLYHSRPTQTYYLAAVGAVIMIMSSLVGFFSQQLVQFQDCLQKDPTAVVSISRVNSYSGTGRDLQNMVPTEFAPMSAAINVGLLQTPGDQTNLLSSGCASGNCTFSDNGTASFSTLAFSHSCVDITSSIRIVNETQGTTYLGIDYEYNQTKEWLRETGAEGVLHSWLPSASLETFVVYFLFRPHWNTTNWKAANCSLFPTINTYAAAVKDAVLDEKPLDHVPLRSIESQFEEPPTYDYNYTNTGTFFSHMMTTNYTIRNGERVSCEGSDSDGPGMYPFMQHSDAATYVNLTGFTNPSAGWKWSYFPIDCYWFIWRFAYQTMTETLGEIFDQRNLTMTRRGGTTGPVHLRVLFEDGNITTSTIDKRMSSLATAITSIIRTNGDPDYPKKRPASMPYDAEGEMWVNTTCVYVRWAWISFPAVEIFLSGVFLILVAIDSRGVEPDRLWKSSFLAALFCEVEVDKHPVGKQEMEKMAKSTSVSLAATSKGLRLIR